MKEWNAAEKIYLAIVEGRPKPAEGTIDQPLRLDPEIYQVHVGPHPDARHAVTHFTQPNATWVSVALLGVELETGRQHQIRAHLAWLGHPVTGDQRYGSAGPRMGLHALRLSITKPGTGQPLVFETPAPGRFFGAVALAFIAHRGMLEKTSGLFQARLGPGEKHHHGEAQGQHQHDRLHDPFRRANIFQHQVRHLDQQPAGYDVADGYPEDISLLKLLE